MRFPSPCFAASLAAAMICVSLGVPPPGAGALAQESPSIGAWLGETGAKGVVSHAAARDFSNSLADSGEFDAAMTEWFRMDAAYHERMIKFNERLIEASAAERGITDPKATTPSQALQQWLAEQDARTQRDNAQAQRIDRSDAAASDQFDAIQLRNAMQAVIEAQTIQRWTTVVVDSSGEIIENDRADVAQAQFEDLMRRHAFEVQAYKELIQRQSEVAAELQDKFAAEVARRQADLAGLDSSFSRAKRELRSLAGAPTSTPTDDLFPMLAECAERARVKYAEAERLGGEAGAARARLADRLMARCEPIGEEINRRLGREEIDRQRERAVDTGLIDDFLVPLVPPSER